MSKISQDLIVWGCEDDQLQLGARCGACGGMGRLMISPEEYDDCEACCGLGWFGIDPQRPVMAHAGSEAKIAMLTTRYASGAALWHPDDGSDEESRRKKLEEANLVQRQLTTAESVTRRDGRDSHRRLARLAP